MHRAVGVVVLFVLVGHHAAQAQGGPPTPPRMQAGQVVRGTAVLRGTVVAADTGVPLRRVQVRAVSTDGQDNNVASTDEQGRFEILELVGGRYTVTATKTGFVPLQYGQRRPGERGTPIEIAAGETREKIALTLPRGGAISGRVMDEFGEPIADAQVMVLRNAFGPGGRRMQPAGRTGSTDDLGSFRIFGLSPGTYVVSATGRSMNMMRMPDGRLAPNGEQGYAPTYYPGTPSVTDAQRIAMGVGQEVSGVVFGLVPTRVSRISGRVIGAPPDEPFAGAVMVSPEDRALGLMNVGGLVQPDGTFELGSVPPGRYVLTIQPRTGRRGDDLVGFTSVTVAGADLSNVVIALRRPGTVRGTIEFEGGAPGGISPGQIQVFPVPADPNAPPMFGMGPPQTSSDFTFTVKGIAQPVLLRVGGASGWSVKSVFFNGENVTDLPLPAAPGVDLEGVRVLLTQSAPTISGVVRDDRGAVVVDTTVLLFPSDETKWGFSSRYVRTTRPDTQGRFEFKSVPAYANYRVIALPALEEGQGSDPDFLLSVRDRAERLGATDGEAKTLDLRLRQ